MIARLRRALRRRGIWGTLRVAPGRVVRELFRTEEHVWYELDPAVVDAKELPEGYVLEHGGPDSLPLPEQDEEGRAHSAHHLARGNELWLVRRAGEVAFSCFLYRRRAPAAAAKGGWLELPPQTVCLESSATVAEHRGRGVAPAAWTMICGRLSAEGVSRLITKVEVDNQPSRRACEKAGFREIARMKLVVRGPLSRVRLTGGGSVTARELKTRLEHG